MSLEFGIALILYSYFFIGVGYVSGYYIKTDEIRKEEKEKREQEREKRIMKILEKNEEIKKDNN